MDLPDSTPLIALPGAARTGLTLGDLRRLVPREENQLADELSKAV